MECTGLGADYIDIQYFFNQDKNGIGTLKLMIICCTYRTNSLMMFVPNKMAFVKEMVV